MKGYNLAAMLEDSLVFMNQGLNLTFFRFLKSRSFEACFFCCIPANPTCHVWLSHGGMTSTNPRRKPSVKASSVVFVFHFSTSEIDTTASCATSHISIDCMQGHGTAQQV